MQPTLVLPSPACDTLPEADPFALVAYPRLERQPRSLRPVARLLVQLLVLRQPLGVDRKLDVGQRLRVGAEEEPQQAGVAQVGELGGGGGEPLLQRPAAGRRELGQLAPPPPPPPPGRGVARPGVAGGAR